MNDGYLFLSLIVIFLLILLNGFFSMSEMAIVSSRKGKLRAKVDEGKKSYKKALHASENPSRYLSTVQIGITLIGILSGAFGSSTFAVPIAHSLMVFPFLAPYATALAVGLVVIVLTFLSIVLGELTPKQFALSKPEKIAAFAVPILEVLAIIFNPVVTFLSRTTTFLLKILHVSSSNDQVITEEEIWIALLEGERHGIVEEKERRMVEGVFYLGDRPVETFMTHRSELAWLELDSDAESIKATVLSLRGQSLFPVVKQGLDDVVGVVAADDLLTAFLDGSWSGMKSIMRKACFIPGTMSSLKAFEVFKRERTDTLLVLDEYGGLAGALSIQDLVEEIVGELSTPDTDSEEIIKREDGSYLMGGLVNVDIFAELFALGGAVPEQRDYHTLAGLVLEIVGAIPRTGEFFTWKGFRFEIMDMDGNRIDKVLVTPPPAPNPEAVD